MSLILNTCEHHCRHLDKGQHYQIETQITSIIQKWTFEEYSFRILSQLSQEKKFLQNI